MENEDQAVVQVIARTEDGKVEVVFTASLSEHIWKLKELISARLTSVTPSDIQLSFSGESLSDDGTVGELGVNAGTTLDLALVLPARPSKHPGIEPPSPAPENRDGGEPSGGDQVIPEEYVMPTAFTVQVTSGKESKEVLVVVEKAKGKKPFLGGYRHKTSGIEYHNMATQTNKQLTSSSFGVEKSQRETQTYVTKNVNQQTQCDAVTQMTKTGCFVSHMTDRIMYAGVYETAEEYHKKRLQAVIVLQKHLRRWLAEKYVNALRKERTEHAKWVSEEEAKRQTERKARIKREFDRRLNPKTKEDFEILYHALEMWRIDELKKINETTSGPERKAALCGLLEQEAQLIASIGRHKILANQENKISSTRKLLDDMAAPRRWIAFDGKTTEMNTPYSLRAQQLKDLYLTLTSSELSLEERKDVLISVKATVSEHDCKLTREIVDLVDREADLIDRGMSTATMEGLRKRISTLFLQYVKTPHFNAAAANHIKVPPDPSVLTSKVYYCRSCCSYLPSVEFQLTTNSHAPGHCRKCVELDNKARHREDHTLYRAMLKSIKHSEEQYKDGSRVIFLLQEMDLKHLVEGIWGGQSILSAETDLFELEMLRWEKDTEWSPWNCILLTKKEANYHRMLDNVYEAYGIVFADKVKQRHVLARNYFTRLPHFVSQMETKVRDVPFLRGPERVVTVAPRKDTKDITSEG